MIFAATAGDFDLTDSEGHFQARIYVAIANKFSADAARRVARQKLAEANEGKPHKGQRAFGWKDAEHVDEREAELLRRARADVINGKTVATVHREWTVGSTVTKRLLTAIARCGKCGSGLSSGTYARGTTSHDRYGFYSYCRKADGGCGGLARSGPPVEEYVETILLDNLRQQAQGIRSTEKEDPEPAKAKATLDQIHVDKTEARQLRADDLLSKVSSLSAAPVRAGSTAARIVREWCDYTVDMKRETIQKRIEAVVIKPAGKGGRQRDFRPGLIEIVWR